MQCKPVLLLLMLGMLEVLAVLLVLEEFVVLVGGIFGRGIYFFLKNFHGPLKAWLAGSLGSVGVGGRATFYLDQSCLLCYFFFGLKIGSSKIYHFVES